MYSSCMFMYVEYKIQSNEKQDGQLYKNNGKIIDLLCVKIRLL